MKINQREGFIPVEIVLESQEEVDKMFAVMNHATLAKALKFSHEDWEQLDKFRSMNYIDFHNALEKVIAD